MKPIPLETLAHYEDQYIALINKRSEIVAAAKTIKELEKLLAAKSIEHAEIQYIPQINAFLSPLCQL